MWVKSKSVGRFPASLGICAVLLIVGLVFSADARAATRNVPGTYATIQLAIDAAVSGVDTVLVDDGIYTENINFNSKEITIQSENGAVSTTITADVSGTSVVTFSDNLGNGAVIDGFTITNGSAAVGGGIICGDSSSPIIRNCVIDSNEATDEGGGGIGIGDSSTPTIESCTISNNTAVGAGPPYIMGGGIHCGNLSSPTIKNCKFISNAANRGGAIAANTATPTFPKITNCTFNDNTATDVGGAIAATDSSWTIRNSIFWEDLIGGEGLSGFEIQGSSSTFDVTYSDVQGEYTGTGNINSDPLFVDSGSNNYHLKSGSPCRNTGNPSPAYSDRDGSPNDMGADGGPGGVWDTTPPTVSAVATPTSGSAPLVVSFTGTATDDWGIASYSWDFGDGDTSSAQNPSHTYNDCGGYIVTLTVTDHSGNSASTTIESIIVGGSSVPVASASVSDEAPNVSSTVTFTGSVIGGGTSPYTWSWDFGDGDTSTAQSPSHTYTTAGAYTPTLAVSDALGCGSSATTVLTVVDSGAIVKKSQLVSANITDTVIVTDGGDIDGVSVEIPDDAIPNDTVITISEIASPPAFPSGISMIGTVAIDFGPNGASFSADVTLTLPYTDADVAAAGISENDIRVYFYNTSTSAWQEETNKAIDTSGDKVSVQVNHFTVFALAGGAPTPPTNLLAAGVSDDQINLKWTDNSSDETGFKIERKTGVLSYTQIDTLVAGIVAYEDTPLDTNTEYCYRVRAYNAYGDSAYTDEKCVTTQETHTGIDWVAHEGGAINVNDRDTGEITAKIVRYEGFIYVASSKWNATDKDYDYFVTKYAIMPNASTPDPNDDLKTPEAGWESVGYDGGANDIVVAMAVNSTGVYVTGKSMNSGTGSPGDNTFLGDDTYIIRNYDWVTIKYNHDGTVASGWPKTFNGDIGGTITLTGGANGNTNGNANGDLEDPDDNNDATDFPPHDIPADIAVDAAGNVYVTGTSYQSDRRQENHTETGAPIYSLISGYDYATIKYDTNGNEAWTGPAGVRTFDGIIPWLNGLGYYSDGNGGDYPVAVKVDSSGNVYVTGASSFEEIITSESLGVQADWTYNKITLGTSAVTVDDYYNDMAISTSEDGLDITLTITDYVGASKIATVAPGYLSVHPTSAGLYTITKDDPEGNYVTIKYNSSGTQQWVVGYDQAGFADEPQDMAVDSSGNVYVTGKSRNSNLDFDYATVKYNSSGTQQWAKRYDGTSTGDSRNDEARSIVINSPDNVYVTGENVYITGSGMEQDEEFPGDTLDSQAGLELNEVRFGSEADAPCGGGTDCDNYYSGMRLHTPGADPEMKTIFGYDGTSRIANFETSYITRPAEGGQYWVGVYTENYVTISYSPTGTTRWTAKFNGPDGGSDQAYALAVDASGVYVTGSSNAKYSSDTVPEGDADLNNYVLNIKYDIADGTTVWDEPVTYSAKIDTVDVDGDGLDDRWETNNDFGFNSIKDITVDGAGNAYIVGVAYLGETSEEVSAYDTLGDQTGLDPGQVRLGSAASTTDDDYNGMQLITPEAVPTWATITDYDGPNKIATISFAGPAYLTPPATLGPYSITSITTNDTLITIKDAPFPDVDDDGLNDEWEEDYGLSTHPFYGADGDDGASGDPDGDGLTNLQEYELGTDPTNMDTDGDGMPDDWEVDNELDPLYDDADEDPDEDGYSNLTEYLNGTDPQVASKVYYVDAGTGAGTICSAASPCATIEEGIAAARDVGGDDIKVSVSAGTYSVTEDVVIPTDVKLIGERWYVCTIDLGNSRQIAPGRSSTLRGFEIIKPATDRHAIEVSSKSSVTITNNVIQGNASADVGIAAIFLNASSAIVENNTIDDGYTGVKTDTADDSSISNNIILNNEYGWTDVSSNLTTDYNDFWNNTNEPAIADNNIFTDPLFVDAAGGNYHLRKVPIQSPCIDRGTTAITYKDKNGSRNDIGADGGPNGEAEDTTVPQAVASAGPTSGPAPLIVGFDGSGSNDEWGIASYSWDFDSLDGLQTDSSEQSPSHTYDTCGGYIARLTVIDHSGNSNSATVEESISVGTDTGVTVSADGSGFPDVGAGIVGDEIDFTAGVTGPSVSYSWSWDFDDENTDDGSGDTIPGILHAYAAPGAYTVTLAVTDDWGCVSLATVPVTIVDETYTLLVAELVDSSVGTTTVEANGIAVEIPGEALSVETVITVSELDYSTIPSFPGDTGDISGILLAVDFGPDGTQFNTPAIITIPYTQPDLAAAGVTDPNDLKVYYYDTTGTYTGTGTQGWVELQDTTVYTTPPKRITATTTHFTVYTMGAGVPTAPTNLSAAAASTSQIDLGWTDTSSDEDGFSIERSSNGGSTYAEIATVGVDVEVYQDSTGLSANTGYCYRVRAYNLNGNSGYSNEYCAITNQASSSKEVGGTQAAGGGGGGGGCFIATAAYGTPMAGQVRILSLFRDEYLLSNALGRRFVAFYYKYSPPIADYIAQHEFLRKLVRIALWPLIWFGLFMLKAGLAGKIGFGIILLLAGGYLLTRWGYRQTVGAPSRRDMP